MSGGVLRGDPPIQPFYLDHDQRNASVAGVPCSAAGAVVTAADIYGSGLTNGVTPNAQGLPEYDQSADATPASGTGRFAMNPAFNLTPSFITNLLAWYIIRTSDLTLCLWCFVDNVFNNTYLRMGHSLAGPASDGPGRYPRWC